MTIDYGCLRTVSRASNFEPIEVATYIAELSPGLRCANPGYSEHYLAGTNRKSPDS